MTKQTKTIFTLTSIFSLIVVAWKTLSYFFEGVGVGFASLLVLLSLMLVIMVKDADTKSRTKDLFYISAVFTILEFLMYFIFEFGIGKVKTQIVFLGIQNVFSLFGLLFFAYIVFRFIMEDNGKQVKFVEFILGNKKIVKKPKQAKEFSNGSLSEKPMNADNTDEQQTIIEPEIQPETPIQTESISQETHDEM